MKFVLATQELNYLLSKLLTVINPKAVNPLHSHCLIEVKGNELILTGTDLTVGMRCRTEAKILQEGAVTLPARRLASLIREIVAMQLEITVDENSTAHIHAGGSQFTVPGVGVEGFPDLPEMEGATRCVVKRKDFYNALYRTAFTVSREDSRYVLTGVLLEVAQSVATFMGTDGKRLARARIPLPVEASFVGRYIIPIKAVEEMLKNLNEDEDEISLFLLEDRLAVESGATRLVTKLLSGSYPDLSEVIPKQSNVDILLDRQELVTVLRQISLFTNQEKQSVRFHFGEGSLHVDSQLAEAGEGNIHVPCDYHGDSFQAAFNPKYMQQILEHSDEEKMRLRMTDPFNPAVIVDEPKEEREEVDNPLFVLMPLRID